MARHDDPIEQYKEWVDHRYTPGYYLGGRVPPGVRNFWSPGDRAWLGLVYVIAGAGGIGLTIAKVHDPELIVLAVLAMSVYLIPGILMLVFPNGLRRKGRDPEHKTHR